MAREFFERAYEFFERFYPWRKEYHKPTPEQAKEEEELCRKIGADIGKLRIQYKNSLESKLPFWFSKKSASEKGANIEIGRLEDSIKYSLQILKQRNYSLFKTYRGNYRKAYREVKQDYGEERAREVREEKESKRTIREKRKQADEEKARVGRKKHSERKKHHRKK